MKIIKLITLFILLYSITGFSQNNIDNYFSHHFIYKDIPLNKQQQNMLVEINENNNYLKKLYHTKDSINLVIKELYDIKKISKNFSDIYKRVVKKINFLEYELSEVKYDIEYYKENNYNLTYRIYQIAISNNNIAKKIKKHEIKEKILESKKYASKANSIIDKLDDASELEDITYLKDANKYAVLAIKSQEKALAECYDLIIKDEIYYAENPKSKITNQNQSDYSTKSRKEQISQPENTTSSSQFTANIFSDKTKNTLNETEKRKNIDISNKDEIIIFKIQIGAFINDVTNNEFNNITNISIDTTDEIDYTKVMTGKFTCYQDALKAKNNIVKTTEYKDAFVVAYLNNGKRIALEIAVNKSLQNSTFITQN